MTGERCTGVALLYSDRPDPRWPISARQVEQLQVLWHRLPKAGQIALRPPPPLGYRGAVVECSSGRRWWAYHGIAELRSGDTVLEYRLDTECEFEKAIAATAPVGLLPAGTIPPSPDGL